MMIKDDKKKHHGKDVVVVKGQFYKDLEWILKSNYIKVSKQSERYKYEGNN